MTVSPAEKCCPSTDSLLTSGRDRVFVKIVLNPVFKFLLKVLGHSKTVNLEWQL